MPYPLGHGGAYGEKRTDSSKVGVRFPAGRTLKKGRSSVSHRRRRFSATRWKDSREKSVKCVLNFYRDCKTCRISFSLEYFGRASRFEHVGAVSPSRRFNRSTKPARSSTTVERRSRRLHRRSASMTSSNVTLRESHDREHVSSRSFYRFTLFKKGTSRLANPASRPPVGEGNDHRRAERRSTSDRKPSTDRALPRAQRESHSLFILV